VALRHRGGSRGEGDRSPPPKRKEKGGRKGEGKSGKKGEKMGKEKRSIGR